MLRLLAFSVLLCASLQALAAGSCHTLFRKHAVPSGMIPISGYANVFNVLDHAGDIVLPGAFKEALETQNPSTIKMLSSHSPLDQVGAWTLLREDGYGLYVEGYINPRSEAGLKLLKMMTSTVVGGLSIGFRSLKAHRVAPGERALEKVALWEVSLVAEPMNPLSFFRIDDSSNLPLPPRRTQKPADWLHLFF